jgi:hypothetical protein
MSGAGELRMRLDQDFPGRELISKAEAAAWLGISKKTLAKRYTLPPGSLVSKAALIKELIRG